MNREIVVEPGDVLTIRVAPAPVPSPQPPPPPPAPPQPTPQPGNAQLLWREDFAGDLSAWDGPDSRNAGCRIVIEQGRRCLRVDQPQFGWGGELMRSIPERDEVFLQLDWFAPSALDLSDVAKPGAQHFFRIGGPGGVNNSNQFNTETNYGDGVQAQLFWSHEENLRTLFAMPRDRWFRLGTHLKLGAVGQANGSIAVYLDGALVLSRTGMSRSASDRIGSLRLVTNYDGAAAGRGHWYYSNVEVWDRKP